MRRCRVRCRRRWRSPASCCRWRELPRFRWLAASSCDRTAAHGARPASLCPSSCRWRSSVSVSSHGTMLERCRRRRRSASCSRSALSPARICAGRPDLSWPGNWPCGCRLSACPAWSTPKPCSGSAPFRSWSRAGCKPSSTVPTSSGAWRVNAHRPAPATSSQITRKPDKAGSGRPIAVRSSRTFRGR